MDSCFRRNDGFAETSGGTVGANQDTSFYWLERIHSLAGVVLLAVLVFVYLPFNSLALMGPDIYDAALAAVRSFPLTAYAEIVFLWVPLVFYIMMGLVIVVRSSANVIAYSYYRNWLYFLQRVSGVIALVFIVVHIWIMRVAPAIGDVRATFAYRQAHIGTSWLTVLYAVGTVAVIFHLFNGLTNALASWGILRGRKAQLRISMVMWVLMIVVGLWGMRILIAFTG